MQIAYYDESGDDGYPNYSSPLFALSAVYLHYLHWQETFDRLRGFRQHLRSAFGLPVQWEMHTRAFVLNKKPYGVLRLSEADRQLILDDYCDLIASLDVRIVNVVIAKPRITSPNYQVLDTALKYSVQRIENDLNPAQHPEAKFLIVTDPGRVGKMRSTTRRIQRVNYIPSRFGPTPYRREIRSLIEDPLPKDSKESYFVQMADLVAHIVYLYVALDEPGVALHGRTPDFVTRAKVRDWLHRLSPSLNLAASGKDPFGVKVHPQ